MSDNKLIDLHKVAGLFREIQTEEFAKEEVKQESEFKKTIEALETTEQEVAEELTAAQKKLPALIGQFRREYVVQEYLHQIVGLHQAVHCLAVCWGVNHSCL